MTQSYTILFPKLHLQPFNFKQSTQRGFKSRKYKRRGSEVHPRPHSSNQATAKLLKSHYIVLEPIV
uniref:Uncharacterized protein n=1 Tax=Setaria italica TaxID=4555 RepID=K3XP25_SETIT